MPNRAVLRVDINQDTKNRDFNKPILVEQYKVGILATRGVKVHKGQKCIVEEMDFGAWKMSQYFKIIGSLSDINKKSDLSKSNTVHIGNKPMAVKDQVRTAVGTDSVSSKEDKEDTKSSKK